MEVRKTIDHVELIVCDTGPRIAPDGHAKGLEPLYRTLGTNTTGSGLGLPIVQAIATHTGATIQLEYVDESAQTGLPVRVSLLQGNKELASAAFNARVIPSVAYTDPEVAWVGLTEDQAKAQGIKVKKGLFPWAASGRAIANGRDEGFTKLLFDDSPEAGSGDGHAGRGHGKILGGGMVGTASDYGRFAQMLLNGGELEGARIVSRKTLELMTANHLPGNGDLATMSRSLFSEATNAGVGFGLGFAVNIDPAANMIPGSVGEFYWGGMFSTAFFVDPVEKLHMVFMTQLSPSSTYPIRRELKTLIYSALL